MALWTGLFALLTFRSALGLDFVATTIDGKAIKVTDADFTANWQIEGKVDGEPTTLNARDLVMIQFGGKLSSPYPKESHLILATGEVIRGEVRRTEDERLQLRGPPLGEVNVPLTAVRGIILEREASLATLERLRKEILRPGRMSDEIILGNGDVLRGLFMSMDADNVVFLRDDEEMKVPVRTIAAVAFDPNLLDYPAPESFGGQLRLDDGTMLLLDSIVNQGTRLDVKTSFGAECSVNIGGVVDLAFRNGKVTYLSDLEPAEVKLQGYLDRVLTPRMDRSVLGTPIQLEGRLFAKGIGMQSQSSLIYSLDGYERFEAVIGLDDRAGDQASVRYLVFVDGKKAFDSGELTALSSPKPISLSVEGATELRLTVDFAARGNVQDYADWGDARLIRADQK